MTEREFLADSVEPVQPAGSGQPPKPLKSLGRRILGWLATFIGVILFFTFCLYLLFVVIPQGPEIALARGIGKDTSLTITKIAVDSVKVKKEIALLEKKIDKLTTQGPYLIVNTTDNRFYLYSGKELIREGRCSTGKNTRLIAKKRNYEFKTPRGVHTVQSKQKNPVWAKPDWAFIEEGLPIPPPGHESRFDAYTLGDYKLAIGDGYMVHGTLYKRRMGLPVTHGCIRLLDEDLEVVYNTMPIGSKVIIY
ncbi:MAG: hypothetical protein A2X22_05265 [Bacteroidetes bacterium GWF2_49_14]|nr:MAG: hypothetical protein A2X22_05265 [Bacteroidetes bacterium GWF2_49_14]HBB90445.1 hypothetical protein [Bacteroidales bacterium]